MIAVAVLLGICIGLCLGALGGGGSIITVPALVYVLGQPLSAAITQSVVVVSISSLVAVSAHARHNHVRWRAGLCLGAVGGCAAWAGTALGRLVPAEITMAAFAVLMTIVAASMLVRQAASKGATRRSSSRTPLSVGAPADPAEVGLENNPPEEKPAPYGIRTAVKVVVAGVLIGLLSGFFGVGGGFVIVPILVLGLGYSMPVAVGTSLLVITVNSAAALAARVSYEPIDWSIILPVTIAAIVGSVVGKYATQRVSETTLTRAFAALLLIVAAYVGARTIGLLPQ